MMEQQSCYRFSNNSTFHQQGYYINNYKSNTDVEMLASSMMRTTISDDTGFGSSSQITRKSYKADLSSLAANAKADDMGTSAFHHQSASVANCYEMSVDSSSGSDSDGDDWGYYSIDES
mmetsp:Transcript_14285/g.18663  ORF Transcript_14285/g.18663 Transcript_14285/m.18663 type:complete len:119 (-) Transcript_14285:443-799(-)|eukprot:CAMPEP_0198140314 /NCGR_PEP_ID=MMETSP1443-20131203/3489_1 /TAXON_ID=186043 /ORGANISM="Entomoneis sp., Strain CCMP2396" /LENGTH=118 /DNA_ID=CAMNT_0043802693 /DNA_START=217 /DNA_END=573 /DNA_ORIENTATION=-